MLYINSMVNEIKSQIIEALGRPVCTGWDRGFLESILNQLERGRDLSDKQIQTAIKVIDRNGDKAQAIHDEWNGVYIREHKEEALVLANYYNTTGYFSELTKDILKGLVPDMRAYIKMRGNKYAQRVLETHYAEPKYPAGTLVAARANCYTKNIGLADAFTWNAQHKATEAFRSKGGLVLEVTDLIRSAAQGAKTYKILPIGATIPIIVEERYIKLKRKQIRNTKYGMALDIPARYKIGDLVKGYYDIIEYYYWHDDPDDYFVTSHTGVVVEIDYELEYFEDYVYTILCLDGVKRFFIESELIKL